MQKGAIRESGKIISQPVELPGNLASSFEAKVQQSVNKIIRESVLSGLSHFGNKNVVDSLVYILELEHSVNLTELSFDLPSFRSGIYAMFGTGAYILEEHVCNELASRIGVERRGRNLETLIELLSDLIRERTE